MSKQEKPRASNRAIQKHDTVSVSTKEAQSEDRDPLLASLSDLPKISMETFMGPMPHPDALRKYEEILPGCADRMLSMVEREWELTENQAKHRQELERLVVISGSKRADRAQTFAFILSSAFLIGAVLIAIFAQPIAGATLGVIDIGGLIGVFIYGSQNRKQERLEKMRILAERAEGEEV